MKNFLASPRKFVIPLVILALLAFLGVSLMNKPQAPDVTFTTLQGKNIKLASLQGKVVLVNFWATDCPGCIAEMPELIETYKQYHDRGFEIVAVAMSYDPPSQVVNYSTQKALPFLVMHDGFGEIAAHFNDVNLTPTTFVIDKQGHVISHVVGELNFTALRAMLDKQLGEAAGAKVAEKKPAVMEKAS
jgi:peroxiredoxin